MTRYRNLTKRSGTNNYQYREATPKDVLRILISRGEAPKQEVCLSLKTSDLKTAKSRLIELRAAQLAMWNAIRAKATPPARVTPSEEVILRTAVKLYENTLEAKKRKLAAANETGVEATDELVSRERTALKRTVSQQAAGSIDRKLDYLIDAAIANLGWQVRKFDPSGAVTDEYRQISEIFGAAFSSGQDVTLQRWDGNLAATPTNPLMQEALRRRAIRPPAGQSIMELFERYAGQALAQSSKRPDTINQDRKVIELFSGYVGNRSAKSVERADVREFRDLLSALPMKFRTREGYAGLPLKQAAEKAKLDGLPKREARTIAKELSALSGFYRWLIREDFAETNLTTGLFPQFNKTRGKLPVFTVGQFNQIFSSPLFTRSAGIPGNEHVVGNVEIRDWRYWIPICAMFTGARIGEIAQLRVSDIKRLDGVWIFDIVSDDETADPTALKNRASRRIIPIHERLIGYGLLTYVQSVEKTGERRLFPSLVPNSRGHYGAAPSRFWRNYLQRIGIKAADDGLGSHSFRHTFADELRRNGVMDGVISTLLGHSTGTMTERYGSERQGSLDQRSEAVAKLTYAGVNLDHLKTRETDSYQRP
ncbi:MAG: tyrosine-type recombinase/integrase [Sandarakinorhabdus sp.]